VLEIFDKMRHKDLYFSPSRKITRVLLWESQGAHSGTRSNDTVRCFELDSSPSITIQDNIRVFPLHFLGISLIVNPNLRIDTVVRGEEQCNPSKKPEISTMGRTCAKILDEHLIHSKLPKLLKTSRSQSFL
jgi:hypothetical protein